MEAALARVRSEFEPPQEVGELTSDMPFAEYLLEWLDIVKVRVKATTCSACFRWSRERGWNYPCWSPPFTACGVARVAG
mgnify:CR=1 FL=1